MVVPDFELICEIMLVAEGFLDARLLARKFITLYTLCKELLSKQVIKNITQCWLGEERVHLIIKPDTWFVGLLAVTHGVTVLRSSGLCMEKIHFCIIWHLSALKKELRSPKVE